MGEPNRIHEFAKVYLSKSTCKKQTLIVAHEHATPLFLRLGTLISLTFISCSLLLQVVKYEHG
jgi:hypothetical protein